MSVNQPAEQPRGRVPNDPRIQLHESQHKRATHEALHRAAQEALQQKTGPEAKTEEPGFRNMRNFLTEKKITRDNAENFTLPVGIDYLSKYQPQNPNIPLLSDVSVQLKKWNAVDLLNESDPKVFKSRLESIVYDHKKELASQGITAEQIKEKITDAYDKFKPLRDYVLRLLGIQQGIQDTIQEQRTELRENFTEKMEGMLADAGTNFGKMEGYEQALVAGGAVILAAMFLISDNETVDDVREVMKSAAILFGAGYVVNKAYKVVNGKTIFESIGEGLETSVTKSDFWNKSHDIPPEKSQNAAALRKSMIYLGDQSYTDLHEKWMYAKDHHIFKVELLSVNPKDMSSTEIYAALDAHFSKYPLTQEKIAKHKKLIPPTTWLEGMTEALLDNHQIKIEGNAIEQATDTVSDWLTRGYHYVGLGLEKGWDNRSEGWVWLKKTYKETFEKEGTDEEVAKWGEKYVPTDVVRSMNMENFIRSKSTDTFIADGFVNAYRGEKRQYNPEYNVHFYIDDKPGGTQSMYVIAEQPTSLIGDPSALMKAIDGSNERARNFLKKMYPQVADNINLFAQSKFTAYQEDTAVLKSFWSMPLPGSPKYNRLGVRQFGNETGQNKGEVLEMYKNLNYEEIQREKPWMAEQIRIRSLFGSTQLDALSEVTARLSDLYRGLTPEEIDERIADSTNNDIENIALDVLRKNPALIQNLSAYQINYLQDHEDKLQEIEKDVRDLRTGSDYTKDVFIGEMKNIYGYKVRLALLHDPQAMTFVDYKPDSNNPKDINTPAKLMAWYEDLLENRAKTYNKESGI